jgi:hypothetical protein
VPDRPIARPSAEDLLERPVLIAAQIIAVVAAVLHIAFFVLESVL